jgi:hypothetical protein
MATAKLFKRRGSEVALKPSRRPRLRRLSEFVQYLRENFPEGNDFPDIEPSREQQERDLDLDRSAMLHVLHTSA